MLKSLFVLLVLSQMTIYQQLGGQDFSGFKGTPILSTGLTASSYETVYFSENEYILNPGDEFEIIFKEISYSFTTSVDFTGNILLLVPFFRQDVVLHKILDVKKVVGLSLAQLKDSLKTWYKNVLKATNIEVRITRTRMTSLIVSGRTETNGLAWISAGNRLSSVLVDKFACLYDADINNILTITTLGDTQIVNLEEYFLTGNLSQNPLLARIKSVFVPQITHGVLILGAVKGYPIKKFSFQEIPALNGTFKISFEANMYKVPCTDSIKVSQAIERAGGFSSYALTTEIFSSRKGYVTLDDFIPEGDTLFVPPFTDKIFVGGEVKSPGFAPYLPGASLETYLAYCGGLTNRASLKKTYLLRGKRILKYKDVTCIQPGDVIIVPEVRLKWVEDYLQLAQVLSSIIITWLTLSKI